MQGGILALYAHVHAYFTDILRGKQTKVKIDFKIVLEKICCCYSCCAHISPVVASTMTGYKRGEQS